MNKIDSINPTTGEVNKSYKIINKDKISKKMSDSRQSFNFWKKIPVEERCEYLRNIRKEIVESLEEITKVIKKDTGKPDNEILMSDILATLSIIKYYEDNAKDILKKEVRKTPIEFYKNESYVLHEPLGVVTVISPWNYPFQLSMVPTITAIVAGNTVILKPSEITPMVGEKIGEIMENADLPKNVFQVIQGDGNVAKNIIDAKPDKIFFTGSVTTGKKIMKRAADNIIPVELELGGKDPMLVLKDANIDRAIEGAIYGSLANSGQLCVSVERLYVHKKIKEVFLEKLLERIKTINTGSDIEADIGPIINEKQMDIIKEHIDDALEKGAKLLTKMETDNNYIKPQILTEVDHSMKIMQEETFGPVIPIMEFDNIDRAIELANDSIYGLNASVWTEDIEKAKEIANKIETGNCYINDVVKNIGNPYLPFGGKKKSGIGYYHGPEGLKTFTKPKSVMINRNKKSELNWFPYNKKLFETLLKLIETKHSNIGPVQKIKNMINLKKILSKDKNK